MTTNNTTQVLTGFANAAAALGLILAIAWVGLAVLDFFGGPDLRMPAKLLQSAGALVLIGLVLRVLLKGRTESEAS